LLVEYRPSGQGAHKPLRFPARSGRMPLKRSTPSRNLSLTHIISRKKRGLACSPERRHSSTQSLRRISFSEGLIDREQKLLDVQPSPRLAKKPKTKDAGVVCCIMCKKKSLDLGIFMYLDQVIGINSRHHTFRYTLAKSANAFRNIKDCTFWVRETLQHVGVFRGLCSLLIELVALCSEALVWIKTGILQKLNLTKCIPSGVLFGRMSIRGNYHRRNWNPSAQIILLLGSFFRKYIRDFRSSCQLFKYNSVNYIDEFFFLSKVHLCRQSHNAIVPEFLLNLFLFRTLSREESWISPANQGTFGYGHPRAVIFNAYDCGYYWNITQSVQWYLLFSIYTHQSPRHILRR